MKKETPVKSMTRRDFIKTVAVLGTTASTPSILMSCGSSSGTSKSTQTPDVIYYNAKIITLDKANTIASAVAIKDGNFIAVGGNDQIKGLAGTATRLVDLGGKTVVPGFMDGKGPMPSKCRAISVPLPCLPTPTVPGIASVASRCG